MMYVKVMLTLLVAATAALAIAMKPAAQTALAPNEVAAFDTLLTREVPQFNLQNGAAREAVAAIQKQTGVEIHVDWNSLKEAVLEPIGPDERVSFNLHDVSLENVLDAIFQVSLDRYVVYHDTGHSIEISGAGKGNVIFVTRAYDVRDLLSDQYWGVATPAGAEYQAEIDRMTDLCNAIRFSSKGREWDGSTPFWGGSSGSMNGIAGRLIVTQTPAGHREVAHVLGLLRAVK